MNPKSETRQRTAIVSVRFGKAELEAVQELAHAQGLTISTYLRVSALARAEKPSVSWPGHAHHWVPVSSFRLEATGMDYKNYRCGGAGCNATYFETVPS